MQKQGWKSSFQFTLALHVITPSHDIAFHQPSESHLEERNNFTSSTLCIISM